ncbi:uncharacterized protein I303_100315 [Kwoniella dejecticola CBS 10117]|uniref:Uncharacterized protein n=1 Tax=Kwoniella dejecticola CBS 10117 TaxID=1296121 RepID=A0A1A6AEP8_9TREE|nr:uncharacterized protein I303_00315 [Kwoniella dejecticola CBS 10117]OBR88498.1 hypothetical protein I303_00315 [Kwoniella dejecticola CBS 10117]
MQERTFTVAINTQPRALWAVGDTGKGLTGSVFYRPVRIFVSANTEEYEAKETDYSDVLIHIALVPNRDAVNYVPVNFAIPLLGSTPEKREEGWIGTLTVPGLLHSTLREDLVMKVQVIMDETCENCLLGSKVVASLTSNPFH